MLDMFSLVVVPVTDRQRVSACEEVREEEERRREEVDKDAWRWEDMRDEKGEVLKAFTYIPILRVFVHVHVHVHTHVCGLYSPFVVSLSRIRKVPLWLPWPSSCLSASFLPIFPKYHLSP